MATKKKIKSFTVDEEAYNGLVAMFKKYNANVSVSQHVNNCLRDLYYTLTEAEDILKSNKNFKGKTYIMPHLVYRLELYWKEYTKLPCTHYEGTRHSFCTQISEIDDKKAAQDLMRHADSRSTDRHIHSRTEYLRDALKKRGEVVDLKRKMR